MNKVIIENAIISAMNLISDELDSIIVDDLREQFEMTLAELENALKELKKE
jgi:hypothetical protein